MKLMKTFVKRCYSEYLLSSTEVEEEEARDDQSSERLHPYLGGLGIKYKFPGDSKKYNDSLSLDTRRSNTELQATRGVKNQTVDDILTM
jgi:hypothetical protein